MLPVTRAAIAWMGRSLPDKQPAANPIRQTVPLSGLAEPDRPLALTTSRNRPALGASSNESDRGGGAQFNRAGWLGKVWKGQRVLPCRCASHLRGWPSAGGHPQEDRTQISKAQVESLHKCAFRGADSSIFRNATTDHYRASLIHRQSLVKRTHPCDYLPSLFHLIFINMDRRSVSCSVYHFRGDHNLATCSICNYSLPSFT
jgi:hypothetical protein